MSNHRIKFVKSDWYSQSARRYEVLVDGESVGWVIGWSNGEWAGMARTGRNFTQPIIDQDSRRDAAEVIIRTARTDWHTII